MTTIETIENRISAARKYLKILDNFKKYSRRKLEDDLTIRGAVERYLYLAAQAVVDLAEAVLSYKNFRKPTTFSETFYILNEENVISDNLAKKMARMVGFRNVIAYDYMKINYDIVYDVLQNRLKDMEDFLDVTDKII